MTNSSPRKIHPFLRGQLQVNHLFLWAIYTMAMLNNQSVLYVLLKTTKWNGAVFRKYSLGHLEPISGCLIRGWESLWITCGRICTNETGWIFGILPKSSFVSPGFGQSHVCAVRCSSETWIKHDKKNMIKLWIQFEDTVIPQSFPASFGHVHVSKRTMYNVQMCAVLECKPEATSAPSAMMPLPAGVPEKYPLVNVYIAMERSTIFEWENPLFLWPFSIAFCMFTRGYPQKPMVDVGNFLILWDESNWFRTLTSFPKLMHSADVHLSGAMSNQRATHHQKIPMIYHYITMEIPLNHHQTPLKPPVATPSLGFSRPSPALGRFRFTAGELRARGLLGQHSIPNVPCICQ